MDKLTKQNFWNKLHEKHPAEMKKFCDWIDQYKNRVRWDDLFNEYFGDGVSHPSPKYHDLPIAMQIGIFLQYVSEADSFGGIDFGEINNVFDFRTIPDYIQEYFHYENSIHTHHAPVHHVRLQSDAAEAQNPDQANLKGADGRGNESDEGREGEINS